MSDWRAKLVEGINKEFKEPFCSVPVKAWLNDLGFNIKIEGRDVQFDINGEVISAGTSLN